MSCEEIFDICPVDPWFLEQLEQIVAIESTLLSLAKVVDLMRTAKEASYNDNLRGAHRLQSSSSSQAP